MRLAMQLSQFCRLWWPNRVLSDSNQHPVACGCQQHVAANTLISMCCAITSASIFNLLWNWFVHKWPKWSVKPWNYINWMLWNRHNIFLLHSTNGLKFLRTTIWPIDETNVWCRFSVRSNFLLLWCIGERFEIEPFAIYGSIVERRYIHCIKGHVNREKKRAHNCDLPSGD